MLTATIEPPGDDLTVGTLSYTRSRLVNVFIWMLWGDLCLVLSDVIWQRVIPIQLGALGASNAVVGILAGSIFSTMNWVMNPLISTGSDRFRSRLGRRMPFMLFTAPPIALFLIGIGFAVPLSHWLSDHVPALAHLIAGIVGHLLPGCRMLAVSAQVGIGCIAWMMVLFRFFDLFPQCVYYYLFPDIIPQSVMGTFVCLFKVTSTLATIAFHLLLLPYVGTHLQLVYGVIAALYLFTFILLPLRVKEGEYPPPPPRAASAVTAVGTWVGDVYGSSRFFWCYFLTQASFRWAFVPFNLFLLGYAQHKLGMNEGDFGRWMSVALLVQVPALFLLGPMLDRFHATRVSIAGFCMVALAAVVAFFFVTTRDTYIAATIVIYGAVAVVQGATTTLGPRLLPRSRYGQFAAANAMVSESGMIVLQGLCGVMIDHFGPQSLFIWLAAFSVFGVAMTTLLYRVFLNRGGDLAFVPPEVRSDHRPGFPVIT